MENARKPLWLLTEESIAKSKGIYKDYWLAFKQRHPEFYDVAGAPSWFRDGTRAPTSAAESATGVQRQTESSPGSGSAITSSSGDYFFLTRYLI
jgi:hypothetical protein